MTIDLPKHISENIDRFTGRAWLLPHLLNWWEKRDARLFLLTGGPGTGKSMIAAWLAGFGPEPTDSSGRDALARLRALVKAAHFCQASSRNITPQAFAQNLANQLEDTVRGFADAFVATLAERVQIVGTVEAGTVATGSNLAGVAIAQLNLSTLGDELSFDRGFTEPLKKLDAGGHCDPMLLVIDALDEAQTYTGVTLPDLLSRLADLPAQIRIIATSRDDPQVLKFFRNIQPFDLVRDAPCDVDDVREYSAQRLINLLSVTDSKRAEFAERLAKQACGIFLYAAMVLDELLAHPASELPDLDNYPLPDGLSGLYHNFLLSRGLGKDEQRWFDLYEPLLGLIAVAQGEGLTTTQLTEIIGKDIRAVLRASKQYLSGELPDGPFRPFHKSFAEFLLEEKENIDFHIDAATMHRRVADYLWKSHHKDWSRGHAYALLFLARHAAEADAGRLERLLDDPGYLVHAEPAALETELRPRHEAVAAVYESTAHRLRRSAAERAAYLELEAYKLGEPAIAHKFRALGLRPTWSPCWAQWGGMARHRVLARQRDLSALAVGVLDNRQVVAAGGDHVAIYDAKTGQVVRILEGVRGVLGLLWTEIEGVPALVAGGWDGFVSAFSCKGEVFWTARHNSRKLVRALVSAHWNDMPVVISASDDGHLAIRDPATGRPLREFYLPAGVWSLAVLRGYLGGDRLIAGGLDGTLIDRDLQSGICGEPVKVFPAPVTAVTDASIAKRNVVVASGRDARVCVWDPLTRKIIAQAGPHVPSDDSLCNGVAVVKMGECEVIVSGNWNGSLTVRDATTCHALLRAPSGIQSCIESLAVLQSDSLVFTADRYGVLRRWDLSTLDLSSGQQRNEVVDAVCGTWYGNPAVIAACHERWIRVWHLVNGRMLAEHEVDLGGDSIARVATDSQGGRVVFAGPSGAIYTWNGQETVALGQVTDRSARNYVQSLRCFVRGNEQLAVVQERKGAIRLYDLRAGLEIGSRSTNSLSMDVVDWEQASRVVIGSDEGRVRVVDPFSFDELSSFETGRCEGLSAVAGWADTRETLVATGSWSGFVAVWNLSTGTLLAGPWKESTGFITGLALGTLGGRRIVVSASYEGEVIVRDIEANGQAVCTIDIGAYVTRLAIAADSRLVIACLSGVAVVKVDAVGQ